MIAVKLPTTIPLSVIGLRLLGKLVKISGTVVTPNPIPIAQATINKFSCDEKSTLLNIFIP